MKNREKFSKEIFDIIIEGYALAVNENDNNPCSCSSIDCHSCLFCDEKCSCGRIHWLESEYKAPQVDWSKVPVDTPILVKEHEDSDWVRRYFACFIDGRVNAWYGGATSWSACDNKSYWKYAKLAEMDKN